MVRDILIKEAKSVYTWARRFCEDEDLSCWCAICSYELFKRLRRSGLRPIFYQVTEGATAGHCFVLCQGYIVDVTARQFTGDVKFVEVRKSNPNGYWFWSMEPCEDDYLEVETAHTPQRIRKALKDWPSEQNPFKWQREYCK